MSLLLVAKTAGINAGVVLLEPSTAIYDTALRGISAPLHPEHIPGSGPEQDYLSRFYAPWWIHIDVSYNFQLHHVFYNLEACLPWIHANSLSLDELERWLPTRLTVPSGYDSHRACEW